MSTSYTGDDSRGGGHSSQLEQKPLDSRQHGQAANILAETTGTKQPDADLSSSSINSMDAHAAEKVKDQIDGAVAQGPKKADQNSGGRVQVGETGDLHDLAARRQP